VNPHLLFLQSYKLSGGAYKCQLSFVHLSVSLSLYLPTN
jgi:hypothetical protein